MDRVEAIEVALEAYRKPQAVRGVKRAPLPPGMLTLIKLAAASPEEAAQLVTEETARDFPVKEAAIFYLQQQLTGAEDDYRQLALMPGAGLQEVKDHKRGLLKWLHPDRNRNSWESGLFQRVATAADRLEAALRDGAQPAAAGRHRHHRRRPKMAGSWQVAQHRVKQAVGWRSRLLKVAVAAAVIILIVAVAQMALVFLQGEPVSFATSSSLGVHVASPVFDVMEQRSK